MLKYDARSQKAVGIHNLVWIKVCAHWLVLPVFTNSTKTVTRCSFH